MEALNLPITYTTPEVLPTVEAPPEEIKQPSSGLSLSGKAYGAIAEGSTNTIAQWLDTNLLLPHVEQIGDAERPNLDQSKVDQLWAGAGIPDKAPDASRYNDVAIFTLLDAAKRRQAMREIDEATKPGIGSVGRGATVLGLSLLDPVNLISGVFPAASAAKVFGLSKTAASLEALRVAGSTAETLAGRVASRAGLGAIEGAVGNIPLEAITAPMRSSMGEDYHAMDSVANLALGSAIGGGLHIAIGAVKPRIQSATPEPTPTNIIENVSNPLEMEAAISPDTAIPAIKPLETKPQPTAAEMAEIVTPDTREKALATAVTQLENDLSPTVDSILNADPTIGKADAGQITSEFKTMFDPENSYITRDIPPLEPVKEPLKFEDDIDFVAETAKLKARAQEIEELSSRGLYSQKSEQPPELTPRANEIPQEQKISKSEELTQQFTQDFGKDGGKLLESGRVKIVESVKDIPGNHPDNVQGYIRDGQVYLVAENLTPEKLKGVVLHEVGVHANMSKILGKDGFKDLLRQVDTFLNEHEDWRGIVDNSIPADTPKAHIAEERLAYMVENMPEHSIVQKLVAKIKAWLYKNFPSLQKSLKLNDADINELALSSLRNYARESTPERRGELAFYSRSEEIVDTVETELNDLNKIIATTEKNRNVLKDNQWLVDIDSKADFIDNAENLGIKPNLADVIFGDIRKAFNRAEELMLPNPQEYAIDYAIDKLDYGLQAHRVALIHDRAIKNKLTGYLNSTFANKPLAGLSSLTIGTVKHGENARAYTPAYAVGNAKRIYTGQLDAGLSKLGTDKLFYSGALNEDLQRAMWALEDGADVSSLSKEAVETAKLITSIYDNITDTMRQNGMIVNKVPHYLSNQTTLHNQTKVRAAGFENWKNDILPALDIQKTAEAMNIKPSELTDEIFQGMYDGLSTGEHIGNHGTISDFSTPLRAVRQKQRKLIFKDADSIIAYRDKYGSRDFQSAITNTIEGNARKVGLIRTLGVNYERNLKEVAGQFFKESLIPEQRVKLRNFIDNQMINELKVVDGRADIPFNETAARITSNVLALGSMTKLGGATLSAVSDLAVAASYLNRQGMGSTTANLFDLAGKQFTKFSPEKKQALGSIGFFADAKLKDAYRDGYLEGSVNQTLAKWSARFFKMTGLDTWTNSARLSSADSIMNYMSGFTNRKFTELPKSLQNSLKMFEIKESEWGLLRETKQTQIDGGNYLMPQELDNIRSKISDKLASENNISGELLEKATDKYIDRLKNNLINYYHNALSHMVIEPDAATKYYQTWGGLAPGSIGGTLARFTMQFRSFSIGFMRKTLFDMFNEEGSALSKGMNLGKFIAATTLMGYTAMSLKDIFKGRKPRSLFDDDGNLSIKTITASLLQGGGAGIFGDFIFGEYNRFGGGFASTLVGPAFGSIGDYAAIASAVRDGVVDGKAPDVRANLLRVTLNNTPFINAFWSRLALDHLFANGLQEYLNPGYLRRMERKIEQQNHQQFWLPPSQYNLVKP